MVECLLFIGAGSRSRSKTDRLRNTAGGLCPPRVCEHASASFIIFLTLILFLFGDKNSKFRPKFLALLICRILFALCLVQRLVYIFHYPGKVDTWSCERLLTYVICHIHQFWKNKSDFWNRFNFFNSVFLLFLRISKQTSANKRFSVAGGTCTYCTVSTLYRYRYFRYLHRQISSLFWCTGTGFKKRSDIWCIPRNKT